uniref:Reverse transcriptase domain-containing protein n=1 Tax=Tanacetum cinerariifolium TaxID=118510 RepID=A0A6L2L0W4_TANCI|nr:reverse transcriptase domain-containing protein [Tanacetum cinerariifolium]
MSAMANTTPIVTTVTKTATKEKTPNVAETASKINILDFREEHYEDILPVMDKIRRDKRREVHTRLDFGENSKKGHQREIAFKRLSDTYSPSTTKSGPDREYSKGNSHSIGRPHKRNSSPSRDHPRNRGRSHNIEETYGNTCSYRTWDKHRYHSHGIGRSSSMKRGRNSESSLSCVAESCTNEGGHWKLKSKRCKPTDEEDLAVPWSLEIHYIKQKDGETIEEFIERFKIETGRMKGAPECMRISGFMHGVNNPDLIKRLNEHVPKTLEKMMTATAAFIQGETARDRDQQKTGKKDAPVKDKVATIYMIQPWKRVTQQKVTQSFAHVKEITFPPLAAHKGTGGPLVIEAEISGHVVRCIYVDGGSSMEVLNEHCFNRLRLEIKSQMVPATKSLTGFSEETLWPLGQLRLLVTIGDAEHYTRAWMNFMIVRSPSPYNGIIRRSEIREIQAVPSTTHGMLKFPVKGEIVIIRSIILTPTECTTIAETPKDHAKRLKYEHHDRLPSTDSISEKDTPLLDRKTRAGLGARQDNPSRGKKTGRGRNSARSILLLLVIQPSHGQEARR